MKLLPDSVKSLPADAVATISRRIGMSKPPIEWVYDDGGRKAAGFKGEAPGDCVVRALAIASDQPYRIVYDELFQMAGETPRDGVKNSVWKRWMQEHGWTWKPIMGIGTGCTVHLRADELPEGIIVCSLSRHVATVIDQVLHDTYDCSRDGTRCVYGYWHYGPDPAVSDVRVSREVDIIPDLF